MLNRRIIGWCVAALLVVFAGGASAQEPMKLTGAWYQNRGPLVDIPINGKPAGCALFGGNTRPSPPGGTNAAFPDGAHTANSAFGGTLIPAPASLATQRVGACVGILNEPPAPTLGNPNVGAAPTGGGIRATPMAVAIVNPGVAPRSFTVAPGGFNQNAGKQIVAVAVAPTVIQLASTFVLSGPGDQTSIPNDRRMFKSAWTAQTGRLAANFTWCPPGTQAAQLGSCTAPAVAGSTAFPSRLINGLVRYRAGANAFGGTMQMAMSGNADVTVILDVPTGGGMVPIAHQPVAGMGYQEQGAVYGYVGAANFPKAPGHSTYQINFPCTNALPAAPAGCSQVVGSGALTDTSALAPGSNINWGMPWTTGTVTIINTETQFGQPRNTILTAMGSDNRNALGAGNITLVAGGSSYRIQAAQNFAALDLITVNLAPYTPALSPTGVALAGTLIALSAGYILRRRL